MVFRILFGSIFPFFIFSHTVISQVGINTETPFAELDVSGNISTTFAMDVDFSGDTDGISTSGSPGWSVQTYQEYLCFSSNNTTATQNTEVTIEVTIPPQRIAYLTMDIYVDLTIHGLWNVDGDIYSKERNTTSWTPITIPLVEGYNKIKLILYGDNTSNFPGKVAIDNVKAFYEDGYAIRIDDNNQQDGYVLTSDVNGNATWKESRPGIVVDNDEDTYVEALDQNAIIHVVQNNQVYYHEVDSLAIQSDKISFGFPPVNKSTGSLSMTWGAFSEASGTKSTAWGDNSTASNEHATAWGKSNMASGGNSTAFGEGNNAIGKNTTAIGKSNNVSGDQAFASGQNNISSGTNSVAMGEYSRARGINSFAFGAGESLIDTLTATGKGSIAFGRRNRSIGFQSIVLGGWNNESSNSYSMSFGSGNTSSGVGSTAWGIQNEISGGYATGWGYQNSATSEYSTVFGVNSHVSGLHGIAIGYNTVVSGEKGIGVGSGSIARGLNSKAMGGRALGENSIAIGNDSLVFAEGRNSIAIGMHSSNSDSTYSKGDLSLALGRNAKAKGVGSVAIGFSSTNGSSSLAILGGHTEEYNSISIGGQSDALAANSIAFMGGKATGYQAFAWGGGDPYYGYYEDQRNQATGNRAMALGAKSNVASGYGSMVWGVRNQANGDTSTVWGSGNTGYSLLTTAWGKNNIAFAPYTTVWGEGNAAVGNYATVFGRNNSATGIGAVICGESNFAGIENMIAMGQFNQNWKDSIANWTHIWYPTGGFPLDVKYSFGVGTSTTDRADAMTIWESGQVIIGYHDNFQYPDPISTNKALKVLGEVDADAFNTTSDFRLKSSIALLPYGLKEIIKLEPVKYNLHKPNYQNGTIEKSDEFTPSVGLIAQDVFNIIPDAVNKPENEDISIWNIDYTKLIPVLINAVKELNDISDGQKEKISNLETENQALKEQLKKYESLEARIAALENIN